VYDESAVRFSRIILAHLALVIVDLTLSLQQRVRRRSWLHL
jgi:hypothetical protein